MAAALTPRNRCADVFDEVLAAFVRQDWDEIGERYAENFFVESRRAVLRHDAHGRDGSLEGWVAAAEVGAHRAEVTHLATRGERLALSVVRFGDEDTSAEAFTTDVLFINELDADDRIVYAALLDVDNEAAGFAALDERFASGEGAPFADILQRAKAQREALRAGDWDTYRALMHQDMVLVDHRPASLGEISGVDEVIGILKELGPLVGDVRPRLMAWHGLASDVTLGEVVALATAHHGGEIEMAHLRLQQLRDGVVVRVELFPVDELEAAKARFDELSVT